MLSGCHWSGQYGHNFEHLGELTLTPNKFLELELGFRNELGVYPQPPPPRQLQHCNYVVRVGNYLLRRLRV
jgi:hypothetical protein